MSQTRPVRSLPIVQNWDCHQCGNCCTDYVVPVSQAEKERIEGQDWGDVPEFRGQPLVVRNSPWWKFWSKKYRLQAIDDRCVFLDKQGLCRIHGKFGLDAKPFACRLYPFVLVPVGDHWRVSLRFACPSAAANKGRPLLEQKTDLTQYGRELAEWREQTASQQQANLPATAAVRLPQLQRRTTTSWADADLFVKAMLDVVRDADDPLPRRLLRVLELVRICKQAKFTKVSGGKLREFLFLINETLKGEVPADSAQVGPPGWIGRVLFRSSLAIFLRKDQGVRRGIAAGSRLGIMLAAKKMLKGKGPLPRLQEGLPKAAMEQFEQPLGGLEPAAAEALQRYYTVKLESCQFFGDTCYDLGLWDGAAFLLLTFPCIAWLARGYVADGLPQLEAVHKAITVIDENYGFNPLLGHARQKLATRILFSQRELDRLIGWYGR